MKATSQETCILSDNEGYGRVIDPPSLESDNTGLVVSSASNNDAIMPITNRRPKIPRIRDTTDSPIVSLFPGTSDYFFVFGSLNSLTTSARVGALFSIMPAIFDALTPQ